MFHSHRHVLVLTTILTLNLNIKSFAYFAIASGINKYNIMSSMIIATMNQNSMCKTGGNDEKMTPFSASCNPCSPASYLLSPSRLSVLT
ncbi:hypothetical protein ALC53_03371 [Atta colombica]|uniref:Uncharacterized protein n=1 Tax=Atta colombica TaxID=520822 RepID=A0A195BPQ2_9HYME|nr:hypothetical protein ALC53_03371 [Atta colombica]